MEQILKAYIQSRYWDQYSESTKASKPGLLGKITRLPKSVKLGIGLAAMAGLLLSAAAIIPVGVALGFAAAYVGINVAANSSLKAATVKAINKDIANGTLTSRYQTEELNQKPQAVTEPKSQLAQQTVTPSFTAATITTAPAATSGNQRRSSFQPRA